MAIDKKINPINPPIEELPRIDQYAGGTVDIDVNTGQQSPVQMLQDGGAIFGQPTMPEGPMHDDNLADFIDETELEKISSDLMFINIPIKKRLRPKKNGTE